MQQRGSLQKAPRELGYGTWQLAAHRAGRPFNRDVIKGKYWTERAPPPPVRHLRREERTAAPSSDCAVCGHPSFGHSIYCPRCRRFVFWGNHHQGPQLRLLIQPT